MMQNGSVRQFGLVNAVALVVGNMLGAGIFTTSGYTLAAVPSREAVLLLWLIGGLVALMGAVSYGALARVIPVSGGEYVFLSRTVHPAAGYVSGWLSLFCGFSAPVAFAGLAFGEYLQAWNADLSPKVIGSVAILFFAILQAERNRSFTFFQDWLVMLKLFMIVLFAGVAVAHLETPTPAESGTVETQAFLGSLVWIYLAYSGWNAAVYVAGEIREPGRIIPRALLYGTTLVMLMYLGLNAIFVYSASIEVLAGEAEIAKLAAESLAGEGFARFVTTVICVALLTSVSAMTMAGPRVYSKMAEDGFLPGWFKCESPPFRASVYLQTGIALLMIWISGLRGLMTYLGFALGIGAALAVVGLIRLRWKDSTVEVWGWPWIPLGFVASVAVVTGVSIVNSPVESAWGLATIGAGIGAYFFHQRQVKKR